MISFYIIKKNCEKKALCKGCVFLDYGRCILQSGKDPEHWDMDKLQKAYDQLFKEDKTVEVFYKQLADRLIDVMGMKKDGDNSEESYVINTNNMDAYHVKVGEQIDDKTE